MPLTRRQSIFLFVISFSNSIPIFIYQLGRKFLLHSCGPPCRLRYVSTLLSYVPIVVRCWSRFVYSDPSRQFTRACVASTVIGRRFSLVQLAIYVMPSSDTAGQQSHREDLRLYRVPGIQCIIFHYFLASSLHQCFVVMWHQVDIVSS